jgi:hypothetical protein
MSRTVSDRAARMPPAIDAVPASAAVHFKKSRRFNCPSANSFHPPAG